MWTFTLAFLALTALLAVVGFSAFTLPFLCFGSFDYGFSGHKLVSVTPEIAFFCLFFFRYWRLFVHMVAYRFYKPAPPLISPRYTGQDVTVICPTVEPWGDVFRMCCETVCLQFPHAFYIVVGREALVKPAEDVCAGLRVRFPKIDIQVHASPSPGKRIQIDHVIPRIATEITVLIDDHVFWARSGDFLTHGILPAFEDDHISLVGTSKRVIIEKNQSLWKTFWNFIGATYLERHNFEIMATTTIDGGIFAVSGRTCAIRSNILHDPEFRHRYLHETIGFLSFVSGELGADDDNFTTRYMLEKGWGVKIQSFPIETTLGWFPKHLLTSTRWARTTFRSNPRTLLMKRAWLTQPWSVYGVYLAGMINFALVFDPLLVYLFRKTSWNSDWHDFRLLIVWILASKLIKLWPYFRRHPEHLYLAPGYVVFAYVHSFIKLHALLTFYDIGWTGRSTQQIHGPASTT
ncbi:putative Glycosyltransferase 2-like domain-containing protein [Seiridium cardinale]